MEAVGRRMRQIARGQTTIMEVCGTHTMSAARFGLRSLLPEGVRLISGPGCPVCVTDQEDIDLFLALGALPGVTLASFGDMLRVPGSRTSLERERAAGADVRVVYSPLDAVDIARREPDKQVVFFGVGFETTMPATALAIDAAARDAVRNFCVLCAHKTMPAAIRALLSGGELQLSGLLLPGHVTTIIGARAYDFIPAEFRVPCAVAGFEPVDMMLGIQRILEQIAEGRPRVDNAYARAVTDQPNRRARDMVDQVFAVSDSRWRGLGLIPNSGAEIRIEYAEFDARRRFAGAVSECVSGSSVIPTEPGSFCRCGDVLRGAIGPRDCALFGAGCTPTNPRGPCMVSSEGACAAEYRYGGESA